MRNDTGVYEGGEISIYYDPMIAKLVTHAPTRAEAIDAQAAALDAFAIDGIRHNIPFLSALMHHPRWRSGELSTGFIAEEFRESFKAPEPEGEVALRMAAVAAFIDHLGNERKRRISGQMRSANAVAFDRDRVAVLGSEARIPSRSKTEDGVVHLQFGDGVEGRRVPVASRWRPGEPVWLGKGRRRC